MEIAGISLGSFDVTEPELDTVLGSRPLVCKVWRAQPVSVFDGDREIRGFSGHRDIDKILDHLGIKVYPEDIIENASSPLKEPTLGVKIRIKRALPVNFCFNGQGEVVRTWSKTVGGLLLEKGILLNPKDKVSPSLTTRLVANMKVEIIQISFKDIKRVVKIPPPIVYVNDSNLPRGDLKVKKSGSYGEKEQILQVKYRNGQVVSKKVIKEKIIKKPIPRIVSKGTKPVYWGWVTWYGPGFHGRRTASGEAFNMYALTAAHKWLPFGTRVRVTNLATGRSVIVRINDRGPYSYHVLDLSYAAKCRLGMDSVAYVKYEIL